MKWQRWAVAAVGFRLIASLALLGCNDAGFSINPTTGSVDGFGVVDNIPSIGGEWLADASVTANSCGPLFDVPPDEMILQIDQADTAVDIELLAPCEGSLATVSGTIDTSNVLDVSDRRTRVINQSCTLQIETKLTAIADDAGGRIDGSVIIDITPVMAPSVDCGPGFPCGYEQTLDAARCPSSGCPPAVCPSAAP